MRLLNAHSFEMKEFTPQQAPPYVILSHTWGAPDEEVIYQDMQDLEKAKLKKGFHKLEGCCRQALKDRFEWVWIDSCCIDKTSSAELSEAINSMFQWYKNAFICYAYLSDVLSSAALACLPIYVNDFEQSRWFSRGWTLQELIAPQVLYFFNCEWEELGSRTSFAQRLESITGIPIHVLRGGNISEYCALEKMSWARDRYTTREEDIAYSLMGLFDINMPLLYGEGMNAFVRLQEEILRTSGDYTIFGWQDNSLEIDHIFGYSPTQFVPTNEQFDIPQSLRITLDQTSSQPVSIWGRLVNLQMNVAPGNQDDYRPAYLNCSIDGKPLCILVKPSQDGGNQWMRRGRCFLGPASLFSEFFLMTLSFKTARDSTQHTLFHDRYTFFELAPLPSCMTYLKAKHINRDPVEKIVNGERRLVFIHEPADLSDSTTIRLFHQAHDEVEVDLDRLILRGVSQRDVQQVWSHFEELGYAKNASLPWGTFELNFSLSGVNHRAGWCDLQYLDGDDYAQFNTEPPSRSSDWQFLLIRDVFNSESLVTASIRPTRKNTFRIHINCSPADLRNGLAILHNKSYPGDRSSIGY